MSKLLKNEYGFYEVVNKPTQFELEEYYQNKYYQNSKGAYQKDYTEEEKKFIINRIKRKHLTSSKLLNNDAKSFLDIGCGEGWALSYFKRQNFKVTGLDYSTFGCESINPDCKSHIIKGDIIKNIQKLIFKKHKYDIVLLDNVLEHVLSPLEILKNIKNLLNSQGVLIIEVPNDFSFLQRSLISCNFIDKEFWVVVPDHLSYFNSAGLKNICKKAGWNLKHLSTDYPIDFNLFNIDTNYVMDKEKGRNVHLSRVNIENLLDDISEEKTIDLYRIFAEMGLGRNIIAYLQVQ